MWKFYLILVPFGLALFTIQPGYAQDCKPEEFACPNSTICLYREICDGYRDCPGGEDEEENCGECKEFQFKCEGDGNCIESYLRCNWFKDCADGSDEVDCPAPPTATATVADA